MGFTLYELSENYLKVLEMAEDGEDNLLDTLESIEYEIEDKAENIAKILKSLEGNQAALKVEEERLYAKRKSMENKSKELKAYLEEQMIKTGKTKFKTELFSFGIQKNAPSLDVTSEKNIPEEFYVIERKLQRTELLKAVKDGLEIDGVGIKQSESLRIR